MKKISIEQMQSVEGGDIWTISGIACGAMLGCAIIPGVGWAVSAAVFGPTCIGTAIGGLA
ncbi:MAG: hypothetical protein MJ211_05135 [Bacteroidales bacterium]|nr:hypothetical protein [Bacteroidales bacterium]